MSLDTTTSPTSSSISFPFDQETIDQILRAKKIVVDAQFNTQDKTIKSIFSDYKLKLTLSSKFDYNGNGNL